MALEPGRTQLADWIARRSVNQREAARLLDLDFTVLNHILSGRRNPGLGTAVQIEQRTGIPVEAWLPIEDGKDAEPVSADHAKPKIGSR